jgi:acyl-[acyl-carrier-protein] desaturase
MAPDLPSQEILTELEPVVAGNVDRHLRTANDWSPHDYVPWDEGRNFAALGGTDWKPEQSRLTDVGKIAMVTNLLTEDNLPSYHREIAKYFPRDGAWSTWIGRWTAEEHRHSIVMRDYLVVTRGVDPDALEQARMAHVTDGWSFQPVKEPGKANIGHALAYTTFQELATRISHRNTGTISHDPTADRMLTRIAADENLHMIFYRNVCGALLDLAPDQTIEAITNVVTGFRMPGSSLPSFHENAVIMAMHSIYDLRKHLDEVIRPTLRIWNIFQRNDFGPRGDQARNKLGQYLQKLETKATEFEYFRDQQLSQQPQSADPALVGD